MCKQLEKGKSVDRNKSKASIFIDYRNYHYYLEKHAWEIDWERFGALLNEMYDVVAIYYYDGVPSKAVFFDQYPEESLEDFSCMKQAKKDHLNSLRENGFIVRKKLVSRVYDAKTKRYKHKCNFDVELTIDATDGLDNYEVCVLCSGDGDFTRLIRYLKSKRKEVTVIAGKDRLSKSAEKAASRVIHLEDIKPGIMKTRDKA